MEDEYTVRSKPERPLWTPGLSVRVLGERSGENYRGDLVICLNSCPCDLELDGNGERGLERPPKQ